MENVELMAYSLAQTAQATGLHINTVRRLIAENKLPAIHLKRKVLVSKAELAAWLANKNQPVC